MLKMILLKNLLLESLKMNKIVELDDLKVHLRYELDDSTTDEVMPLLVAAESAVLDYITDVFDDFEYPVAICMAVKLYAGYFDTYRNAEAEAPRNGNFMPMPVQALLYKYRDPSVF